MTVRIRVEGPLGGGETSRWMNVARVPGIGDDADELGFPALYVASSFEDHGTLVLVLEPKEFRIPEATEVDDAGDELTAQ